MCYCLLSVCSRRILLFVLLVAGLGYSSQLVAQGCSDAGVCTFVQAGNAEQKDYKHQLRLRYSYGLGQNQVNIHTTSLMYDYRITPRLQASVLLPFVMVQGELANTQGLGDPMLSLQYQFLEKGDWRFHVLAGGRIPANASDKTFFIEEIDTDYPLPMPYQTSLGTWDALLGIVAQQPGVWDFALGVQVPRNWNNNRFTGSPPVSADHPLRKYEYSNQLRRMPDILLRANRQIAFADDKFVLSLGMMASVRVLEDQVYFADTPEFSRANFRKVEGSDGLTLNALVGMKWNITEQLFGDLLVARPLVNRQAFPDGLLRLWVVQTTVGMRF